MFSLNVVVVLYSIHAVSCDSTSNLFGFYTSLRKLCLCRCGMLQTDVPYDMPWLATIYTGKNIFRGTLISDRHVITAASPLLRKTPMDVVVTLGALELCKGENALNISVEAISVHPGFFSAGKFNDLALLKLKSNVMFNKFISPICMPVYDNRQPRCLPARELRCAQNERPTTLKHSVTHAGWCDVADGDRRTYDLTRLFGLGTDFKQINNIGADQIAWTSTWVRNKTEYCLSQITTVPVMPNRSCARNSVYPPEILLSDKGCLGPARSKSIVCEEDIGTPVMTRWSAGSPFRLIGVVTFSSCKDEVSPLFTKIVDNMIWIHENIRNDCQCF